MEQIKSAIVNGRVKVVTSRRVRGVEHRYTLEYSCTPTPETRRRASKEMRENRRKMRELKEFIKQNCPMRYARLFQNVNESFLERIS